MKSFLNAFELLIQHSSKSNVLKKANSLFLSLVISAYVANASYAASTLVTDAAGTQVLWTYEENLRARNLVSKVYQADGKGKHMKRLKRGKQRMNI